MSYLHLIINKKKSSLQSTEVIEQNTEKQYLSLLEVFKEELFNFEVILDYLKQYFQPPSFFDKKQRKRKEVYKESIYHVRRKFSKGFSKITGIF